MTTHGNTLRRTLVISTLAGMTWSMLGIAQPQTPRKEQPPGGREGRGLISQLNTFKTDVPAHPFNIILVSPTATSITASVMSNDKEEIEAFIEFAPLPAGQEPSAIEAVAFRTANATLKPSSPHSFVLTALKPDSAFVYRLRTRPKASKVFESSPAYSFRTPRAPGSAFTFTVQADSHLDPNVTPAVYSRMLANALSDKTDFHVDLGDTFMTDRRGQSFKDTYTQYLAQRYYFGQLCHSAPLFMVLGNHDGEAGHAWRGEDSIAGWSFAQRTKFFPAPSITSAAQTTPYTGRTTMSASGGANYYAFRWGDAQLIVLDPFWFTTTRPRGGGPGGREADTADTANTDDNWSRTLGREQYDWLTRTLETSTAKYKFVFIHHLVGGLGRAARGGAESSVYFEWGGKNADGSPGFAEHRAGWALPIHDLLVKHHVSAVFHGHDHLYVRAERDGLIYQCVPQPGNVLGGTRSAQEYGYASGTILGSPGHLRVRVAREKALVEFIRSAVDDAGDDEKDARDKRNPRREREANGALVHSYQIAPSPSK